MQAGPLIGRAPTIAVRSLAALVATLGLAGAVWFAATPIHVTSHQRVGVLQPVGEQNTGLVVTDQTRAEAHTVSCVPLLRYDSSSNQDAACRPHVNGRLRLGGVGAGVFLAGSFLWIVSGGDRSLGLSGRPTMR